MKGSVAVAVTFMVVLLVTFSAEAAVKGYCVNCHTMHNSQNGNAMIFGTADSGPMSDLLRSTCVGCHSNTASAQTIVTLGTAPDESRIPIVFNTNEPTYPADGSDTSALAGGNFYWVKNSGDAYGHNVFGIVGADVALVAGAPGAPNAVQGNANCVDCHISLATAESGCQGCHQPAHHAGAGSGIVTDAANGWYRFLGTVMPSQNGGVEGVEDSDWEQAPDATRHNVYKGTATGYDGAAGLSHSSIGQFCSGCHSDFHHGAAINGDGMTSVTGAWIRHPSDVVLPDDADKEYINYTVYNPLAPVAKQTLAAASSAVVPGEDLVTCLSCHRPHGSPYPDMLRWDYLNGCTAGVESTDCGCFSCHTSKDG